MGGAARVQAAGTPTRRALYAHEIASHEVGRFPSPTFGTTALGLAQDGVDCIKIQYQSPSPPDLACVRARVPTPFFWLWLVVRRRRFSRARGKNDGQNDTAYWAWLLHRGDISCRGADGFIRTCSRDPQVMGDDAGDG